MIRFVALAAILISVTVNAFADELPPPAKSGPIDSRIEIYLDKEAKEPRLVISRYVFDRLAAGGDAVGVASASRTQALFGGLLLSASLIVGGVWFARRRKMSGAVISGILIAVASGSALVFANVPPPAFVKIDSKIFNKEINDRKEAHGQIKVEVSDNEIFDGIRLVVPMAAKTKGE